MNIQLNNKLVIKTLCGRKDILIDLPQGNYNIISDYAKTIIYPEGQSFDFPNENWIFEGDPQYATSFSDIPFLIIQDSNNKFPRYDIDWFYENVNISLFKDNALVHEIPSGNMGCFNLYYLYDQENKIIALMISSCGLDEKDYIFK